MEELLIDIAKSAITGAVAAWLTYHFVSRSKRSDSLHEERLNSFKVITKKLGSCERYLEAKVAEAAGAEFSPHPDDLAEEDNKSALEHKEELRIILQEHDMYFSASSREVLKSVKQYFTTLCSLQLIEATSDMTDIPYYKNGVEMVRHCISVLYNDIGYENKH